MDVDNTNPIIPTRPWAGERRLMKNELTPKRRTARIMRRPKADLAIVIQYQPDDSFEIGKFEDRDQCAIALSGFLNGNTREIRSINIKKDNPTTGEKED
jgi:hypothetical protein